MCSMHACVYACVCVLCVYAFMYACMRGVRACVTRQCQPLLRQRDKGREGGRERERQRERETEREFVMNCVP
jgi:hypothetical protein